MTTAEVEQVDFEPEDDDLLAEDMPMEEDPSPSLPLIPPPKLKSTITGAPPPPAENPNPKKTKGRGFKDPMEVDRGDRYGQFESLDSAGGPGPQRSVEGWIVLVTGVHEEAQEDDIHEMFAEFGELKNLHLNLDRRTGFVKGYALIEYENRKEAQAAIDSLHGADLLTQTIGVSWAFSTGPKGARQARRTERRRNY